MNVISHDIHFETMPTLYETVNFRVPQKLREYEGKLCTFPEGFRYTRFCIFEEWKNHTRALPEALLQQLRTWTSKMPKLKATFITNRTGASARLSCYIYLHKPITISEVFECVTVSPLLSPHGLDVVSHELDPNAYLKPDKRVIHAANGTFDVGSP
ncbi:hypothetical protein QFC21_007097 [Naganishia friedmannii]|uniref:Uncharacterized protein n=1 Tax=Naganishia friedmannii TaxID=89922 RepID=A0ACC2UXI6_9TREE|nr:hypothetical protein QFC21_007097 [Naganishia friedmannii]